jgi:hypothetical protein
MLMSENPRQLVNYVFTLARERVGAFSAHTQEQIFFERMCNPEIRMQQHLTEKYTREVVHNGLVASERQRN